VVCLLNIQKEARGLDVAPNTISKFRSAGDQTSADLIEKTILPDEITHVAAGLKWFAIVATAQ